MKNIFRILRLAKPLYGVMLFISLLIILSSALQLAAPIISKWIVDEIVLQIKGESGDLDILYQLVSLSFFVNILGIIFNALTNRYGDYFGGEIRKYLTETFYDKILKLPQSYFDSEVSGKVVNQLNRGIFTIQDFLNTSTNFTIPTFLQSFLTIIILSYYNVAIGFFVFLLFPVYMSISYYSAHRWGKREVIKNKIEDITRGRLSEVVSNIRLVKSFTTEKQEYDFISGNLSDINKIYAKQSREFHLLDFLRNFSLNVILLGISIIVFYKTFQGDLELSELFLIIQLVNQARVPLFGMSFILEQVQRAESGSKEYLEVLDLPSAEDYNNQSDYEIIKNPTINFKNVKFKYDKSENVLDDISFTVKQNEVVALVGPSGAGKSTLINLILKFYNPTEGEITLNDKSYNDLTAYTIRKNISLVFQDNELFSSTIKDNVAYGTKASDEEIIEALKKANAWGFVQKLSDGINSEIGERGVRLSGGQKQRIQIARAILKNAPILILDEATSNLDAKSESEVQDALETLMKDKLVIIIAHRFSTIQNASKVIVLNNQKIEDIGSPQELAKKDGIYSELLHYQVEGNKKLLKKFDIVLG